jgi:hypothetical protein
MAVSEIELLVIERVRTRRLVARQPGRALLARSAFVGARSRWSCLSGTSVAFVRRQTSTPRVGASHLRVVIAVKSHTQGEISKMSDKQNAKGSGNGSRVALEPIRGTRGGTNLWPRNVPLELENPTLLVSRPHRAGLRVAGSNRT